MRAKVLGALSKFHRITSDVPASAWATHYRRFLVEAALIRPGEVFDRAMLSQHLTVFAFLVGVPLHQLPAILEAFLSGESTSNGQSVERVSE